MKAALLTEPRTFSVTDVPTPAPGPGEVLVRVRYTGVCGSDLHFWQNGRIGDVSLTEPFVMGHELCGVIEDTNGVSSSPPVGTRVAVEPAVSCGGCPFCLSGRENICPHVKFTGFPPYQGAFAELLAIHAENVCHLPDNISDEVAPLLETLAVALHGFELVPNVKGKDCALLGAGSVGLLVLTELVRRGANVSLVTEPVAERREFARKIGCAHVFDPRDREGIRSHLDRIDNYGPELVFEAAGEPESFQDAFDLARPGGMVCIFGIYPKGSFTIDFSHPRRKELVSVFVRRSLPRNYPEAIHLVSKGKIDIAPLITHSFPLSDIGQAFELAVARRDGVIKTVVRI